MKGKGIGPLREDEMQDAKALPVTARSEQINLERDGR